MGRDFRALVPSENKIAIFYFIQIALKNRRSKGMDFFESVGVNKDFSNPTPVFPEHLEQLVR